jgi:membrane-associated phospholipid phosphatase
VSPSGASDDGARDSANPAVDAPQDVVAPDRPEPVSDSAVAVAVAVDVAKVSREQQPSTPSATVLLCVCAGLGLVALTTWVARQGTTIPGLDQTVHRWVVEHRTPGSIAIARAATFGGVTSVMLPALVVVGTVAARGGRDYLRRVRTGVTVTVVASVGVFVGLRINAMVGRVRPPQADWQGVAGGPSFPSGHTSCATLVALAAAWVIAERVRPGWPRVLVWVGAAVWAFSVGASRVWLGVHWPTDVLGGWLFGLTWFAGAVTVVALLRRRSSQRQPVQADLGSA